MVTQPKYTSWRGNWSATRGFGYEGLECRRDVLMAAVQVGVGIVLSCGKDCGRSLGVGMWEGTGADGFAWVADVSFLRGLAP